MATKLDKIRFQDDATNVLTVTNSIWVKESIFPLIKQDFIDLLNSTYNAQVQSLNEQDATAQINRWVNELTKGKIEKIVGKWIIIFNKVLFIIKILTVKLKVMTKASVALLTTFKLVLYTPCFIMNLKGI